MSGYEFKVVPAPREGFGRALFLGDPSAMHLAEAVNTLADEGWTFLRSDTLPVPARTRLLFGWTTRRDVLVFRRPRQHRSSQPLGLRRARPADPAAFARDVKDLVAEVPPFVARRAA